jgi:AraC family transcriptional regulator of adaptative response/methylated-DNA-[protein]-cysteine methyltransferase
METARYQTDDERWQAVSERDPAAENRFVYAVKTTGIYCRPTCPSRRPARANTEFYATPAAAEARGYRPCRRCRPEASAGPQAERLDMVLAACRKIEESPEPIGLEALAAFYGLSRFHFQRLFKKVLGLSPAAYAKACRVRRLRAELAAGREVDRAVYAAGFGSPSRVYEQSDRVLGMTPGAFRGGGKGLRIACALISTSLGWLLLAATDKGLCGLDFGPTREGLAELAARRFPEAELVADDPALMALAERIAAAVDAGEALNDLPLDVRGTAFQHTVWQALREIPRGRTVSYAELAARIDRPKAVRAVARACADNPLAVVIPCHRAVAADGALTGYRWGLERKREILKRERQAVEASEEGE